MVIVNTVLFCLLPVWALAVVLRQTASWSLTIQAASLVAVVGIVGGGGIGATLLTAFDRYEFDSAAAILIVIIAIFAPLSVNRYRKPR